MSDESRPEPTSTALPPISGSLYQWPQPDGGMVVVILARLGWGDQRLRRNVHLTSVRQPAQVFVRAQQF